LFKQHAKLYEQLASHRVTSYSYEADRALMTSRSVHDQHAWVSSRRYSCARGVDSISASDLDLGLLGHGYIVTAEPLLYDLSQLINEDKPPDTRTRLQPVPLSDRTHWVLGR
jgi:hypothetical protein